VIDALHISESGLKATQTWLDHISNNVANMHTPGFKKMAVNFQDMVSSPPASAQQQPASAGKADFTVLGSRLSAPNVDLSQGPLSSTSRPLDIAIKGSGMLEVVLDNGEFAYTRLGSLEVNNDGFLAVRGGSMLSDRIQVPVDLKEIEIRKDGTVIGTYSDSNAFSEVELGRIQIADVVSSSALRPIGNSMFQLHDRSDVVLRQPGKDGSGEILQGYLEMSNVDLVGEMTNIVLAQRAYQLNARLIQTADQILETINNLRR
jgi:flagellar basal-body rod protein FlgG